MNIDKAFIENVIREVIREELGQGAPSLERCVDPSGIITVNPDTAALERFQQDGVRLKDVFSLEESPRMGCGMMEVEDTTFNWTLDYDEVDYIIDGTLDILIDGRKVSAGAGSIVLIPKGSKISFSAKGKARFMYVVYPANWAEQ